MPYCVQNSMEVTDTRAMPAALELQVTDAMLMMSAQNQHVQW